MFVSYPPLFLGRCVFCVHACTACMRGKGKAPVESKGLVHAMDAGWQISRSLSSLAPDSAFTYSTKQKTQIQRRSYLVVGSEESSSDVPLSPRAGGDVAVKKKWQIREDKKRKDVLSIGWKQNLKEERKNERSVEKMYCRSLRVQERGRRWVNGESINAINSEVLVDELMPIVERSENYKSALAFCQTPQHTRAI